MFMVSSADGYLANCDRIATRSLPPQSFCSLHMIKVLNDCTLQHMMSMTCHKGRNGGVNSIIYLKRLKRL